uniref:carph-isopro domain-containing protein n=1 Tax=Celeribacter naphthalenivorans TaxID=1614694 RepID=UPI00384E1C44
MKPASKIISKLGGAAKVAAIAGVHRTRVYKWMRAQEDGGTGGIIPQRHIPKIISAAKEMGIELTGDDFLPVACGGDVS